MTTKMLKMELFALVSAFAFLGLADTWYAAPDATADGDGSEAKPYQLTTATFQKLDSSAHTLILKPGTYKVDEALARNGYGTLRGETGNPADVVLDFQGKSQGFRTAGGIILHSFTVSNCVANSSSDHQIAGVRVGGLDKDAEAGKRCVLSNAVVTCCTNLSGTDGIGGVCVLSDGFVYNTRVENCSGSRCGGIQTVEYAGQGGGPAVYDSEICNNSGETGGVRNGFFYNCSIHDNVGNTRGGGAYSPFRLDNCRIYGNRVTTGFRGAGVMYWSRVKSDAYAGTQIVTNTVIASNTGASFGGGIAFVGGNPLEVVDCVITNHAVAHNTNSDLADGGAVQVTSSALPVALRRCLIADNIASAGGGVSWHASGGNLTVEGCTFRNNLATNDTNSSFLGVGGALCVTSNAAPVTSSLCVSDTVFADNRAVNTWTGTSDHRGHGGAVAFVAPNRSPVAGCAFTNCTFFGNTATGSGGAVAFGNQNGDVGVTNGCDFTACVFSNNVAYVGGAFCVRSYGGATDPGMTIRSCLFTHNQATFQGGALYFVNSQQAFLDNCTIAFNQVGGAGAGVYFRWGGTIRNSVFYNNRLNGGNDNGDWSTAAVCPISNSVFYPYMDGVRAPTSAGNLNADPKFVDAEHENYALQSSSPCKNAGMYLDWMASATDLAGNPRVFPLESRLVDVGAYERGYQVGTVFLVR